MFKSNEAAPEGERHGAKASRRRQGCACGCQKLVEILSRARQMIPYLLAFCARQGLGALPKPDKRWRASAKNLLRPVDEEFTARRAKRSITLSLAMRPLSTLAWEMNTFRMRGR
jgi:hypothetical protein